MRLRQWIGLVAMLGVLLHAGLIVRHNAAMLAAGLDQHLDQHRAIAVLGPICQGGRAPASPERQSPTSHEPRGPFGDCPMCMGVASPVAVLDTAPLVLLSPDQLAVRLTVVAETIALRLAAVRPPSRGPPSVA